MKLLSNQTINEDMKKLFVKLVCLADQFSWHYALHYALTLFAKDQRPLKSSPSPKLVYQLLSHYA